LIFSCMFSQALFMFLLSFKFSKAADLFEILIGYCFLMPSSLSFPRLSFHFRLLYCLFNYCQSFPNFCNHQIVTSITVSSTERLYKIEEKLGAISQLEKFKLWLISTLLLAWSRVLHIQLMIVLKKLSHPPCNVIVCKLFTVIF
jgi:hypothetical protein